MTKKDEDKLAEEVLKHLKSLISIEFELVDRAGVTFQNRVIHVSKGRNKEILVLLPHEVIVPSSLITIGDKIDYAKNKITNDLKDFLKRTKQQMKNVKCMVVSDYISQEARNLMKSMNMNYCDSNGNIFINLDWYYLEKEAPQSRKQYKKQNENRAFNYKGLKITKEFILYPDFISHPYRDMSKNMNEAFARDTLKRVVDNLRELNYLEGTRKNRRIIRENSLIEEWLKNYDLIEDKEKKAAIASSTEIKRLKSKLKE